jgi:ABC-type Mn2+/Zn2+ transport system permease subunit
MMGLAALIGALSGIIGLYLSFYIKVASGAAIVLVATAVFGVVFLVVPRKKLLKV